MACHVRGRARQARGWYGSEGIVGLAGDDDMRDVTALLDYLEGRQRE